MPQSPFKLSPYKLSIFRQCPRRYKYHYVDGLYYQYRKYWPHLTMGDHVHTTLSEFFSRTNRDRSLHKMEAILRRRWAAKREGFETRQQEKEYGEKALEQLRWFCDTQDLQAQPYMVEALHRVALSAELVLMGKVDRVDRCPDGSFHVIDYKTGRSARQEELQLLAYAVLLNKKFRSEVSRVSFLHLNGIGWQSSEPTGDVIEQVEGQLFAARDEIEAEQEFAPRRSRLCHWCDFAEICEAVGAEDRDFDPGDEPDFAAVCD